MRFSIFQKEFELKICCIEITMQWYCHKSMIEIDGSIGGGQLLRTAVGISTLTLNPFKIINIRKGRSNPGLRPQHLTGVKVAAKICKAEVRGAAVGSTSIEFVPKSHDFSDIDIDIGTAGSLSLLLQTLTPALTFCNKPLTLRAKGGTAGLGAPTVEFTKYITIPTISKLGARPPEFEILRQGFYPKGGGEVRLKFFPTAQLQSISLLERGDVKDIYGFSIAANLKESVAKRQENSAKTVLQKNGFDCEINSSVVNSNSAGTSLTLISSCKNSTLGSDAIGQIGKRAEIVGEEATKKLVTSINSGMAFDKHTSDQIIPFLALAKGRSEITIEELTDHVRTNILVTQKMLDVNFDVNEKERKIIVEGIGHKSPE